MKKKKKSSGSSLEIREYGSGNPSRSSRVTPLSAKVDTNFADKRRSLVDSGHGVFYTYAHVIKCFGTSERGKRKVIKEVCRFEAGIP
jgi:hypothetical protein